MIRDVAVIVRPRQICQNEQIEAWIVLERTSTELEHLLITILCDLFAHKTFNMDVHMLEHVLDEDKFAKIDSDFKSSLEAWICHFGRYHSCSSILLPDPVPGELLWIDNQTIPVRLLHDNGIVCRVRVRRQLITMPLSNLKVVAKQLLEAENFTIRQISLLKAALPALD